jgi:hypothetical protein
VVEVGEVRVVVVVVVVWRHCFGDRCLAIWAGVIEAGDRAAAGAEVASAEADLVAVAADLVEVSEEAVTSEVEVLVVAGKEFSSQRRKDAKKDLCSNLPLRLCAFARKNSASIYQFPNNYG